MYKIGLGVGVILMCCSVAMLIKSKRNAMDIVVGALMVAVIVIAASELI